MLIVLVHNQLLAHVELRSGVLCFVQFALAWFILHSARKRSVPLIASALQCSRLDPWCACFQVSFLCAVACDAEAFDVRGTADKEGGPAVVAACSARRWLARNAAGVKLVHGYRLAAASACTNLVACLPALEDVRLRLPASEDLGNLLEALAWCPRLTALDLCIDDEGDDDADVDPYSYEYDEEDMRRFPDAPAFAKLHSLTKL